ncbi:MAG: hypothetical protein K6F30_02170 [Lachnospiraceae bacterium]|nr:hypothetical protein [Lachnospiraceae bacterium]
MSASEKLQKMADSITDFNVDLAVKTAEFNYEGAKKGFEKAERAHFKTVEKVLDKVNELDERKSGEDHEEE